jgi:hypothetical protein
METDGEYLLILAMGESIAGQIDVLCSKASLDERALQAQNVQLVAGLE